MLSAPAAIPAMIEVSFPAGFTPAETTRVARERDPLGDQLRQPRLLGQRHHRHQARARHQMLIIEQRRGRATTHAVVSLPVPSGFGSNQDLDTPDSSDPRRHFHVQTRRTDHATRSTDRGLAMRSQQVFSVA